MNNPTERDQRIARESAVKLAYNLWGSGHNEEDICHVGPFILAAIQDAKPQGNEAWKDLAVRARTELELLEAHWSLIVRQFRYPQSLEYRAKSRDAVCQEIYDCQKADAARGVQPAAKAATQKMWLCTATGHDEHTFDEETGYCKHCAPAAKEERDVCSKCGSTNTWRTARGSVRCDQCNRWSRPAAQQESALAAEQWEVKEIPHSCMADLFDGRELLAHMPVNAAKRVADMHNAALAASSPSEQKSSLPAETV